MGLFVRAMLFGAGLALSSCAIHPLPEDVTGLTTDDIVRQIRCETREAARQLVLEEFRIRANRDGDPAGRIARSLLDQYDGDDKRDNISSFKPEVSFADFKITKAYFDVIYETGIAYDFELTMSEKNNLGANLNLLGPWAPKLTLGLTADYNRDRSNKRTLTVTDTVGKLLKNLSHERGGEHYCDGRLAGPNYVYPLVGKIGVYKTLKQFVSSAVFDKLNLDKTPSPWVDELTFTTTFDASVGPTPVISFNQAGAGLQAANASILPSATRTDTHKVTIGVSLGSTAGRNDLTTLQDFVFDTGAKPSLSRSSGGGGLLRGRSIIAHPSNDAERLAAEAVDRVKSREITLLPAP